MIQMQYKLLIPRWRWDKDERGSYTVKVELPTIEAVVTLAIDDEGLAGVLGPRAVDTKRKMSVLADGLIKCNVVSTRSIEPAVKP